MFFWEKTLPHTQGIEEYFSQTISQDELQLKHIATHVPATSCKDSSSLLQSAAVVWSCRVGHNLNVDFIRLTVDGCLAIRALNNLADLLSTCLAHTNAYSSRQLLTIHIVKIVRLALPYGTG
ncbi:unnamed protein product [Schistocephalus solidus]|uniref:RNase H domain-containing protein n=1 Tax=Schistocephalus solidus TaxID=70667 RepID=A0A183SPU2_SCHSO|nr:unnamed protein product [Schistocephalus solidus]